jgi:hypothetical protein
MLPSSLASVIESAPAPPSTTPQVSDAESAVLQDSDLIVTRRGRLGIIVSLDRKLYVMRHSANRRRMRSLFGARVYRGVQLVSLHDYPVNATVYRLKLRLVQRNVMKSVAVRLLGTMELRPVEQMLSAVGIATETLNGEISECIGNIDGPIHSRALRPPPRKLVPTEVAGVQQAFADALRRPLNVVKTEQRC